MSPLKQFFSASNRIDTISDHDKKQLNSYHEIIYAFSRTTNASIYIIDYEKKEFEYVSENPLFLCGHSAEEVMQLGYAFYLKNVPSEDLQLLIQINKIGFDFFDRIPVAERRFYSISYDFHLITDEKERKLVNQKLTPIFLTETGKIWKALCIVTHSHEKVAGNIKVYKKWGLDILRYDLLQGRWKTNKKIDLTFRDVQILELSMRSYTINEIAAELFLSPDTIKFHRRKLFKKLDVSSMSEAIFFAEANKLI
ncbi:response regulator transcription factor [Sphingobacterium bambusae]|uniref:Response regulator transcription factor n=1 Tax=Sphingobacterium bambusae TaxID=662858 RepID=A0ABW6BHM7_9SPHI|nr:helix-turn-helix transcriptional regulator [Sphingobacterium bambusae]WPL49421.1 helix-turn-helix transcriptional regulator [Sphingobacterium bambusae]